MCAFVLLCIPLLLHAQQQSGIEEWYRKSELMNQNQVEYRAVPGYRLAACEEYLTCIFESPKTAFGSKLVSGDGNLVAFVKVHPVWCAPDSVYIQYDLLPDLKNRINDYHWWVVRSDYFDNTGQMLPPSAFRERVTYKPADYVRSFNADTVFTYSLKMLHPYREKYNHCLSLLIQKKSRGVISLYCLYNDAVQAKGVDAYLDSLRGVFWYRKPEDYVKYVRNTPPRAVKLRKRNK